MRAASATVVACSVLALSGCGGSSNGVCSGLGTGGCGSSDFETALLAAAQQAGLDVPPWQACRQTAAPAARVATDVALGQQAGVPGTPTFFVNGTALVGAQPLALLQSAVVAARTAAEQSGIPAAQYYAETFPDLPVGDSPVRGPADAWVTVLEFGDFECPYCGEEEPTVKQLLQNNVDVRLVFKNFPLESVHPHALPAAIAAECALDQGKFWEMHDAIYADQAAIFAGD